MISEQLRIDLKNLLSPFLQVENRQRIIHEALGDDSPDIRELSYTGETPAFIDDLIYYLEDKEAYPGRNALVAIVETVKRSAQAGQKRELDTLQRSLEAQLETRRYNPQPNHIFVSHATADDKVAVRIAHDLQKLGVTVWVDNDRLEGGHHWRAEIFRGLRQAETIVVLLSKNSVMRPWVHREVSSALVLNRQILPLQIDPEVFDLMKDHHIMGQITASQFIDLTHPDDDLTYQSALDDIHRAILRRDERESPYRGLSSFEAADAEIFFGREQESQDLQQQILKQSHNRLMIISGASGSGKSSLMKAGVIGAFLKENEKRYNPAFAKWHYDLITPDSDLLTSVAKKLALETDHELEDIKTKFREDVSALHTLIKRIMTGAPSEARYVLFIDQLEEVFRQADDSTIIFEQLLHAVSEPNGQTMVVATIRSDFMHLLTITYPQIATMLNQGNNEYRVAEMTRDGMRRTIEEPARRVGLMFEGDLALKILDDARDEPGSLPLLQYTLTQLYDIQDDLLITYDEYEEIGGLTNSLAKHAEEVYLSLNKRRKDQDIIRRLLLELVTIGERNDNMTFTRKRRPVSEIIASVLIATDWTEDDVRVVIDILLSAEARLLSMSQGNLDGSADVTVVIVHETLLENWGRLKQWLEDNRSILIQRNQYDRNVQRWEHLRNQRQNSTNVTNIAEKSPLDIFLAPAQQFIENPDSTIFMTDRYRDYFCDAFAYPASDWVKNDRERKYLLKEQDIKPLQSIIEQAEQDWYIPDVLHDYVTESEANIRRIRRLRVATVSVISILAIIASILAIFSYFTAQAEQVARQDAEEQRNIAVEQSQLALSRQLAVQSQLALADGDLEQAFTLGIESYQVADTVDSLSSLLTSLQASPQLERYIFNADQEIRSLAVHDNQSDVVLGLSNGDLLFYDLETNTLRHTIASIHDGAVWDMVYINAGSQLLTVGSDGWVKLWDTQTFDLLQEIVRDEVGSMYAIAQNPISDEFAFGGDDGIIYLWDGIGEAVTSVPAHSDTIYALDFSSDGLSFASASADRTISLWDTNNFEEAQASLEAHTNWVLDVAFSPDNTLIVASGADNLITVWDVASSELLTTLDNHNGWVRDLEFVDNQQFISASEDKTLILWDMQNLPQVTAISRPMLGHQEGIFDIALVNTGSLLSVSNDGYLIEWFAEPQIALGQAMTAIDGRIYDTDLNDQGNILASAVDSQIIITDMGTGLPIQDPIMLEGIASSLVFAPNSTEFVVGLDNGATQIWDVATRRLINEVNNQGQAIYSAIYDLEGNQLASAGESAIITLQNLVTDSSQSLLGHEDRINALTFSPDGTQLASAGHDEQIRLWDTATGALLATFERIHNRPIEALVFSPDGLILYSAGRDTQILIWDVESQSLLASLSEHSNIVSTLAINQTGDYLVSGGLDGDVILWDTATQTSIGRYISNSDDVVDLEFTPEQLSIVASYTSGQTIIWDVNVVTWQLNACNSIRQEQQSICE